MTFLHPGFLVLLLALPLLWFFPKGERRNWQVGLRALCLGLLSCGLARPVQIASKEAPVHVFVLDASSSALALQTSPTELLDELHAAARRQPDQAEAHLVLAGDPDLEGDLQGEDLRGWDGVQTVSSDIESSPLATALQTAGRMIPVGRGGAITLVSDGQGTDVWALPGLQSLTSRGIPIHTRTLSRPDNDTFPVSLEPASSGPLRVGRTVRLSAELVGPKDLPSEVDLILRGPDGEVARAEGFVFTQRGRASLEFEPDRAGFFSFELEVVSVAGANADATNDILVRTLAIDEPQRALYLGERIVSGEREVQSLVGKGMAIESWDGSQLTAENLADFDLAIVDDLPADSLGEASQVALVEAVQRSGLGLFVSGGAASFGPGGYHKQPLEEVLPVEFIQKEEKRDPSTTLVVIIDTSGSMGGNRVQLAKEVARLSIRRLLPHDKVGIVEFYGAKHWAAPIQPASNAIELERALNRLDAGGGTVILPAIEEAFYGLKNVQTRYKHVLVLTDGGVESGAFEPLLRNMADEGINVSTVLIGPEAHSEFLVTLANWGKGRFYSVPNRFNLPEILLKQPASAKLPSYRPGTHAVQARGGSGWWGEVDPSTAPSLAGYVETRDRPGSEVLLETSEGSHPLIGSWRHGLGRVTAFTSEPTGPGTEPWSEWPGFGPFFARVLERTASDQRSPYSYRLEREGTEVIFTAKRLHPAAPMPSVQRVLQDSDELSGQGPDLDLWERAPGVFEARFAVSQVEEVRVYCQSPGINLTTRLVSNVNVQPENRVDPERAFDPQRLSEVTGGEILEPSASLTEFIPSTSKGENPYAIRRVWPAFVLAALLAYLLEIYLRRREGRVTASAQ